MNTDRSTPSGKLKVICIAGARPNFMKVAPLMAAFEKQPEIEAVLVHSGQHYDRAMSRLFFDELGIPRPDYNLEVGSASHAVQTGLVMQRLEGVLLEEKPDLVIVVGDVNSTLAGALTAVKLGIQVAHVEAGLRSFDRTMPEEINRVLTDAISHFLFTTEPSARDHLLGEGIPEERIFFTGNVMIDTVLGHLDRASRSEILSVIGVEPESYGLVTIHRPGNVDDPDTLGGIIEALVEISAHVPVIFPCHPRTRSNIERFGLHARLSRRPGAGGINIVEPLGYLDFLKLMNEALLVITDSGGIQEETTILDVPCLTVRENTERPVTIAEGTNVLVGNDRGLLVSKATEIISGNRPRGGVPDLWDGHAADRIADILSTLEP